MTTKALITQQYLTNIANAIRQKLGVSTTYYPSEMPDAIRAIMTADLEPLSATSNGIYTPSANKDGFSQVTVNVPVDVPFTVSEYDNAIVFTGSAVSSQDDAVVITT